MLRIKMQLFLIFLTLINLIYSNADEKITISKTILDNYIEVGLNNNLALQEKEFDLEYSVQVLKEARGMFFPTVTLNSRYTWADGPDMTFPAGEMLNPIYEALNSLHGLNFPTDLGDQVIYGVPEREQETSIRIIQPLFIPRVYFNLRLNARLSDARETDILIYKRQLTSEIKQAYFNYLKAVNVVLVYEKMQDVLNENLRVSETLFTSGKATEDVVYRAKTEIANLTLKFAEAEKNITLSRAYFNYLLNRPLDSEIDYMETGEITYEFNYTIEEAEALALTFREEMILFGNYLEAQDYAVLLSRSSSFPEISAVFNYGYSGESFRFDTDNDFWSASIVLRWELFNGLSNIARTKQATIEQKQLSIRLEELRESIRLEVKEAYNNLIVAQKSIAASTEGLTAAQKYFDIISYKYSEGISTQMEYMDAQTNLTNAEINMLISRFDFYINYAIFGSVTALQNKDIESISVLPISKEQE